MCIQIPKPACWQPHPKPTSHGTILQEQSQRTIEEQADAQEEYWSQVAPLIEASRIDNDCSTGKGCLQDYRETYQQAQRQQNRDDPRPPSTVWFGSDQVPEEPIEIEVCAPLVNQSSLRSQLTLALTDEEAVLLQASKGEVRKSVINRSNDALSAKDM